MPTISKIRFTNVKYEQGMKRYHDEIFNFDQHNGAIILENGGGKTVFIQSAIQAIIPHVTVSNRAIKESLYLEEGPAHIAIEWILNDRPRQYLVTAVTLFTRNNKMDSYRYVYSYGERDAHQLTEIPFTKQDGDSQYPASKDEMLAYFQSVVQQFPMRAKLFNQSIISYTDYLQENYDIVREEWENIIEMNSSEGGIEKVFEECKSTQELFDRLLIPSVEKADKYFNPLSMTDQFEKQRSNLKKYKEFSEKKIEYNEIEKEMAHYVSKFQVLDEASRNYMDKKDFAAAYFRHLEKTKTQTKNKMIVIEETIDELNTTAETLQKQGKALEIYKEQAKKSQLEQECQALQQQMEALDIQIENVVAEKDAIEYAGFREENQQAEIVIAQAEQLLQQEQDKQDLADLQNDLELVKGNRLYLLETQKEKYDNEIENLQRQRQALRDKKQEMESLLVQLNKQLRAMHDALVKNETTIEMKNADLIALRKILVSHESDSVALLLKGWNSRSLELEHTNRQNEEHQRLLMQQIVENEEKQQKNQKELHELQVKLASIKSRLDIFETEEDDLKVSLRQHLNRVSAERIHNTKDSYAAQLQEKRQQLIDQLQVKRVEERKAYRYLDDYQQQNQFFADAYIAEQIKNWSQFSMIQTGTEYLENIGKMMDVSQLNYPFWAITLITTTDEKQALLDKIQVITDRLMVPIIVLSTKEAQRLAEGETFDKSWIAPSFWYEKLDKDVFIQWKKTALSEAEVVKLDIAAMDEQLTSIQQLQRKLEEFLRKYTNEELQQLLKEREESEHRMKIVGIEQGHLAKGKDVLQQQYGDLTKLMADNTDELKNLQENLILNATKYLKVEKEIIFYEELRNVEQEKIEKQERLLSRSTLDLKDVESQDGEAMESLSSLRAELDQKVLNHDIYQNRSKLIAKKTLSSDFELRLLEKQLTDQINKTSATTNQLMERIKMNQEKLRSSQAKMKQIKTRNSKVVEDAVLPLQADLKIDGLFREEKVLTSRLKDILREFNAREGAMNSAAGTIHTLLQQYGEVLPERTQPLEKISEMLEIDEKNNKQQLALQKSEEQRLNKMYKAFEQQMMKTTEDYHTHELNKIKNPKTTLSVNQETAFVYEYEKELKQLFSDLEQLNKVFKLQQLNLENEKKSFRQFCERLNDKKMRQMAIDGVEKRQSYAEILKHHQMLGLTIQQAIKIADAAIQEYDKDQQQIIQYALQQVTRVRNSLLEIPKKTRIQTQDDRKNIYQFVIPEWDDNEAKEAIRSHIDWILTTLEQDKFLDESGNENATEVRKFLEKQLKTVPIMHQVLGTSKMQVKCRKVESENSISSNFYSWEQSNKWSGGESWSKNMTLYLGILKFIAEKSGKQANAKVSRTLILDNPFGRASSDHVLIPVFYIAKQLGFQIITLTALAEGKFISDYFPVVYSCTLRSVQNGSHLVIKKEQRLNKAYFADAEPEKLDYVGEKEQMTLLFDDE